ncbi:uncharacterized protein N7511_008440 [Penicillium nucicola]|uniref:uncharacterized protein n=1 Tax=Penicillium nucicola TaxID=1850975 RepID=UPI0025459C81|nr:uncharacterized protein N7511_008440 [Penicillium nucicola]KAJ5751475.1 hypothetical protein N7511_008440 [Penicillium nucicola]
MFNRFRIEPVRVSTKSSVSGSSSSGGRSSPATVEPEPRLHHRWVFLTYFQCSLESKDDFEEGFSDMLQRNELTASTYYGCREHHATEGIHYHVLVNLGKQPNWSFKTARSNFIVLNNECDSLHIVSTPRAEQNISRYIDDHVKYCEKEKGGDCFGQRPIASVEKQELKRIWEEIGSQPDAPANIAKLKKHFPGVIQALQLLRD